MPELTAEQPAAAPQQTPQSQPAAVPAAPAARPAQSQQSQAESSDIVQPAPSSPSQQLPSGLQGQPQAQGGGGGPQVVLQTAQGESVLSPELSANLLMVQEVTQRSIQICLTALMQTGNDAQTAIEIIMSGVYDDDLLELALAQSHEAQDQEEEEGGQPPQGGNDGDHDSDDDDAVD